MEGGGWMGEEWGGVGGVGEGDGSGEEEIGMVLVGGYFSRKKYGDAAVSKAWVSLLEDCIGIGELGKEHTLTEHLRMFGPLLDVNFNSFDELETWLDSKLVELER